MSPASRTTRLTVRALLAAGVATGLCLGTQVAPALAADDPYVVVPAANPDLPNRCGLDVVLAIDASYSIKNSGRLEELRNAARGLVSAVADKSTRVGIVTFAATARSAVPLTYASSQSIAAGGVHRVAIDSYKSAAGTDWQAALRAVRGQFTSARPGAARLAVIISDGAPTEYTNAAGQTITTNGGKRTAQSVDAGATEANYLKDNGAHILAVGTGKALSGSEVARYQGALRQISGPDIAPPGAFVAATTDLLLQPDLSILAAQFRQIATESLDAPGCSFLSLQTTPSSLRFGSRSFSLTARLVTSGGAALAGQSVAIQTRAPGASNWSALRTATTNSAGVVTVPASTKKNREYRALFAGSGGQNAVTSATITAVVHPKVTAKVRTHRSGKATVATFFGKVKPKKAVKKVFLQKRVSGVWTKQAKSKVKAKGKYSVTTTMTRKGKWRVYVKPSASYGDGGSKTFKVKA